MRKSYLAILAATGVSYYLHPFCATLPVILAMIVGSACVIAVNNMILEKLAVNGKDFGGSVYALAFIEALLHHGNGSASAQAIASPKVERALRALEETAWFRVCCAAVKFLGPVPCAFGFMAIQPKAD